MTTTTGAPTVPSAPDKREIQYDGRLDAGGGFVAGATCASLGLVVGYLVTIISECVIHTLWGVEPNEAEKQACHRVGSIVAVVVCLSPLLEVDEMDGDPLSLESKGNCFND